MVSPSEATPSGGEPRASHAGPWNRVAAAVLAFEAVFVITAAGQLFFRVLPDLTSRDAHRSGDASLTVLFGAVPIGVGAAFALVVAGPSELLGTDPAAPAHAFTARSRRDPVDG